LYGVKPIHTTIKYLQANFWEYVQQTQGNMICTNQLENYDFDHNNPWSQILANCAWTIRSRMHSVLDSTLEKNVFILLE
jgi:polysaccharide pyruvyl transferase WcaK-like protein